jgi:hypothetical protein
METQTGQRGRGRKQGIRQNRVVGPGSSLIFTFLYGCKSRVKLGLKKNRASKATTRGRRIEKYVDAFMWWLNVVYYLPQMHNRRSFIPTLYFHSHPDATHQNVLYIRGRTTHALQARGISRCLFPWRRDPSAPLL